MYRYLLIESVFNITLDQNDFLVLRDQKWVLTRNENKTKNILLYLSIKK